MTGGIAAGGVTACLIVKDETAFIADCVRSLMGLRPVVREVCVLDTGSTDGTQDVARRLGCRVVQGAWQDDFALARNTVVALAQTPWVLSIDADEVLHSDTLRLSRLIDTADARGLESLVLELDDVRDGRTVSTTPIVRMFRPEAARFRNRIHEIVVHRDGRPLRGARVPRDVAHLTHHGYGPAAAMQRRRDRNSRIGDLEVDDLLAQGAAADQVVEALVNRGRSKAIGGSEAEGIPDWLAARALTTDSPFRALAGELLASAYIDQGDVSAASHLLGQLGAEGSDASQIAWLAGRAFAAAGRPAEALDCLRHVDRPINARGLVGSAAPVLQARMLAAAEVGDTEEALRSAIPLLARHGVIHGFGRIVLLCRGGHEPEELAGLLVAAGVEHVPALIAEFGRHEGEGARVAAELARVTATLPGR